MFCRFASCWLVGVLVAHDGRARIIIGMRLPPWREGAPPLHFYLGGIAFFLLVGLLPKNTRSTFGTRRGRAFALIHFARFLLLSFSLSCFSFSFFRFLSVCCYSICFLPSLFLVFVFFSFPFLLFVVSLVLSCLPFFALYF